MFQDKTFKAISEVIIVMNSRYPFWSFITPPFHLNGYFYPLISSEYDDDNSDNGTLVCNKRKLAANEGERRREKINSGSGWGGVEDRATAVLTFIFPLSYNFPFPIPIVGAVDNTEVSS